MKRILYVLTQTHYGGAAKYVHDLALMLSDKEEYTVFVAAGEGVEEPWMSELTPEGIEVIRLKHVKRNLSPLHDLLSGFELLKLYRKVQPDVIHLNSSKVGATGAVAAGLYRKAKVVYTVHGLVLNEPLSAFYKAFYWFAEWFGAKFKNTLIAVSEHDKQSVITQGIAKEEKVHVVHNGIGLAPSQFLSREKARTALGLDDRFTIGTIAGLYSTKGLIFALEALRSLSQEERDTLHYVIIGEGPERNTLEKFIEQYNLNHSVTLVGAKEQGQQYLKAFDTFLLSSVKEGLSYTLIEARAAGLPIIATNVGGNPEIITHNTHGLLVPPADAQALSEAITKLHSDATLRETLANVTQEDLDKFSLERMVSKTSEHYN